MPIETGFNVAQGGQPLLGGGYAGAPTPATPYTNPFSNLMYGQPQLNNAPQQQGNPVTDMLSNIDTATSLLNAPSKINEGIDTLGNWFSGTETALGSGLGGVGSGASGPASYLPDGFSLGTSDVTGTAFGETISSGVKGADAASSLSGFGGTVGKALGGAGFGLMAGGYLGKLFGGSSQGGQIGGGIGGAVGSLALGGLSTGLGASLGAVGSIVPGIGTVIGTVAGSLLGSFFGPGKPHPESGYNTAKIDSTGALSGYTLGAKHVDTSTGNNVAGEFSNYLQDQSKKYGVKLKDFNSDFAYSPTQYSNSLISVTDAGKGTGVNQQFDINDEAARNAAYKKMFDYMAKQSGYDPAKLQEKAPTSANQVNINVAPTNTGAFDKFLADYRNKQNVNAA